MERRNGPWQIQKTENKYRDEFLSLCVDEVIKPDGNPGTYATVQLKEGVAVLALDDDGKVYLTRQFRYAIGCESIEVISGGIDEGEDPLAAARREAREELGVEGEDWRPLQSFHLETSMIKGPVHLYVVKALHCTDTDPDDTEDIKGFRVPMEEAVQMVLRGEITHGPSCVLILKAFMSREVDN
jgi:8-oxo-dGTP pyrophosphatase MutT (NUDIX family)